MGVGGKNSGHVIKPPTKLWRRTTRGGEKAANKLISHLRAAELGKNVRRRIRAQHQLQRRRSGRLFQHCGGKDWKEDRKFASHDTNFVTTSGSKTR